MIISKLLKLVTGKYRLITIRGESMCPTLNDGDIKWVDYSKNTLNDLKNGDIVLFKNPMGKNLIVKRIERHDQDKGYWMKGDNRFPLESSDSEMFGHIKLEHLKGKILY
jgi:signal peptidase I